MQNLNIKTDFKKNSPDATRKQSISPEKDSTSKTDESGTYKSPKVALDENGNEILISAYTNKPVKCYPGETLEKQNERLRRNFKTARKNRKRQKDLVSNLKEHKYGLKMKNGQLKFRIQQLTVNATKEYTKHKQKLEDLKTHRIHLLKQQASLDTHINYLKKSYAKAKRSTHTKLSRNISEDLENIDFAGDEFENRPDQSVFIPKDNYYANDGMAGSLNYEDTSRLGDEGFGQLRTTNARQNKLKSDLPINGIDNEKSNEEQTEKTKVNSPNFFDPKNAPYGAPPGFESAKKYMTNIPGLTNFETGSVDYTHPYADYSFGSPDLSGNYPPRDPSDLNFFGNFPVIEPRSSLMDSQSSSQIFEQTAPISPLSVSDFNHSFTNGGARNSQQDLLFDEFDITESDGNKNQDEFGFMMDDDC